MISEIFTVGVFILAVLGVYFAGKVEGLEEGYWDGFEDATQKEDEIIIIKND